MEIQDRAPAKKQSNPFKGHPLGCVYDALADGDCEEGAIDALASQVTAQLILAAHFANGTGGFPRSLPTAIKWWKQAANNWDSAEAYFNLAMHYEAGGEVRPNRAQARDYLSRAAAQKYPEALYQLALAYCDEGKERRFNIRHDPLMAEKYFAAAAHEGQPAAAYWMAVRHESGDGIDQDSAKARQLLLCAADQNYSYALYEVGAAYCAKSDTRPFAIPYDPVAGEGYLVKALRAGRTEAAYVLGSLHADRENFAQSLVYLATAVAAGMTEAETLAADVFNRAYAAAAEKRAFELMHAILCQPAHAGESRSSTCTSSAGARRPMIARTRASHSALLR